jgi:hypothetical protein
MSLRTGALPKVIEPFLSKLVALGSILSTAKQIKINK